MSNVSLEIFAQRFASAVLLTEVNLDAQLKDLNEFDSMGKIAVSTMIEDLFAFQVPYEMLHGDQSIRQLYAYCLDDSSH